MPIIQSTHLINGEQVIINIEMDKAPAPETPYTDTRQITEKVIKAAQDYFAEGLSLARNCASSMAETLNSMGENVRPDEIEAQLSIKLDAVAGAVLTKLGAEAQLQVKMKWTTKKKA
jgi:hypothetical protein